MFNNPSIQSNITAFNGNSFVDLLGFGMYSSSGTVYYYFMDLSANKVFILNDQWSFITFKAFNCPACMIYINNNLYMTGNNNVWKLEQDLNILINYKPGDPYYPQYLYF